MNALFLTLGILLGVLIYRLGRWEGERGKVISTSVRRKSTSVSNARLLEKIEQYDGK